jgi:hypothetical protein
MLPKKTISAVFLLLCALAQAQERVCTPPLEAMLRVELYFGRSIEGGRHVSDREWAQFLTHELTPRFPGLTVLDARGAWKRGEHQMRELTKVVVMVMPDGVASRGQIAAVAESYKTRFHQTSVGIVTQPVCASFD